MKVGCGPSMDRAEAQIRRSLPGPRNRHRGLPAQPGLSAGRQPLPDVRVYLERTPLFNASMAPNGMMTVWTGLMLRVENEAQLAAVLGHGSATSSSAIPSEQLRDAKSRAAFAQFLGLFGAVGALGTDRHAGRHVRVLARKPRCAPTASAWS